MNRSAGRPRLRVLRELLSIFRSNEPLSAMSKNFTQMLKLTNDMTVQAGDIFFGTQTDPEVRTQIYEADVQVNKLQRTIRRQVITHLSIHENTPSLPYCLLLMSLVKDVERLGDYAKNLSDAIALYGDALPDDAIVRELREIRSGVEGLSAAAAEVFVTSDRERALELTRHGRELTHRCEALLRQIAQSDYDASRTAAVALATRYYKRIGGHVLNVLSSATMPLHKLDYYDEQELDSEESTK